MSYTTDPNDPDLTHGIDHEAVDQASKYLILSEEERAKGFVRPVYQSYIHDQGRGGCGGVTTMSLPLSETYARDPSFYGATYCAICYRHRPVGTGSEFTWLDKEGSSTGIRVGT